MTIENDGKIDVSDSEVFESVSFRQLGDSEEDNAVIDKFKKAFGVDDSDVVE